MPVGTLFKRRSNIERQWDRFRGGLSLSRQCNVGDEILASWERSARYIDTAVPTDFAPLADEYNLRHRWKDSALRAAVMSEEDNMKQIANEGGMVAAIADTGGRLMWTTASNYMRSRAESVNFRAGGIWDEKSVGTNAVGLSLSLRKPVTVFSSEHYLPSIREWVCYAAPIIHPQTRECMGVLDVSTTWDHYTPLGQSAAAGIANSIASHLPAIQPRAELEIHALGQPRVIYRGKLINLPRRQMEIVCLLALSPQGMSLEQLHAALYGDSPVSSSTLKAELSRLRTRFNGAVGSRPYSLQMPVWADFIQIWQALQSKHGNEALRLYQGPFFPQSDAPELENWRHCIEAAMEKSLDTCKDSAMLMARLQTSLPGGELIRDRLSELLDENIYRKK